MIKFFRTIRQNLIIENKTSRYVTYAIGEIILVVIGILIALQINNWNSSRIDNKRVDAFVEKLKIQTQNNIDKTEDYIANFDSYFKISQELVYIIGEKTIEDIDPKIDSLVNVNYHDYHLNLDTNIITEGRENGDLALLSSDKLRQALYNLITENIALTERERITNEDLNLLFVPYLNRNMNLRNRTPISTIGKSKLYKNDNYKILDDQEFENYIISRMEYNKDNLEVYKKMKYLLESIYKLIETH